MSAVKFRIPGTAGVELLVEQRGVRTMGEPAEDAAIKTYRYVRLAIVVVVLSLVAAVVIERAKATCWQGSFSAYYYTPVHAMFVGALVAIGVALIAIKGRGWEDMLLNVAGLLAVLVAFVPTSPPGTVCTSSPFGSIDAEAYIDNNVLALAIGATVAIGVALLIARAEKEPLAAFDRYTVTGLVLSGVLMSIGLVWYAAFRAGFLEHAHYVTAIAMFVMIGGVILINAKPGRSRFRWLHALLLGVMIGAAIGIGLAGWVIDDWRHWVLWLELAELVPFVVFWGAQTLEHWKAGLPPELRAPTASRPAGQTGWPDGVPQSQPERRNTR